MKYEETFCIVASVAQGMAPALSREVHSSQCSAQPVFAPSLESFFEGKEFCCFFYSGES